MDRTKIFLIISTILNAMLIIVIFFKSALNAFVVERIKDMRGRRQVKVDHDVKRVHDIEKILPENKLREWIDYSENIAPFTMDFSRSLHALQDYNQNVKGIFINKKLQNKFKQFVCVCTELSNFIGQHYWIMNNKMDFIKMYPDDNANSERYRVAMQQAPLIANNFLKKYNAYRISVKKILLL